MLRNQRRQFSEAVPPRSIQERLKSGRDGFSRITDDEMKLIMKHAVDHVYHLLLLRAEDPLEYESKIRFGERYTAKWDEPQIPRRRRSG